ncbi:MAG: hypothetical protein JXA69_21025 [Phycisphaerae bacterium]|nr:hypothetical protein [Phycisphaerae bacterium]
MTEPQNPEPLSEQTSINPDDAAAPPDGPQPMPRNGPKHTLLRIVALTVAIGGVFYVLASATVGQTRGATRSTQLKFEQRQRQIDEAVRKDAAAEAVASEPSKPPVTE